MNSDSRTDDDSRGRKKQYQDDLRHCSLWKPAEFVGAEVARLESKLKMCEAIVHEMKIASEARPITREIGTQIEVTLRHCFDEVVWMPIMQGADAVIESKIDTEQEDVVPGLDVDSKTNSEGEIDEIDGELAESAIKGHKRQEARINEIVEVGSDVEELGALGDDTPAKGKESRFRMRREITMDTGAGDNVMPKRMVNKSKIRPSAGSRRGLNYVAASSRRIPNEGEINFDFESLEGHKETLVLQIAVNKALGSVAYVVDRAFRVVHDEHGDRRRHVVHGAPTN